MQSRERNVVEGYNKDTDIPRWQDPGSHGKRGVPSVDRCELGDVSIYGSFKEQHDSRLRVVLNKLQDANVTLNDKCEFTQNNQQVSRSCHR